VIGVSNIAYPVCVILAAVFFAGVGLTVFGGRSLARLSKFAIPMDSVSAESEESSVGQNQEEEEE
jgi:hypothetical protein